MADVVNVQQRSDMKQAAGKIIGAALFAAGVAAVWLWPKPKAEVVASMDVWLPASRPIGAGGSS